jgi:hypothetical protein
VIRPHSDRGQGRKPVKAGEDTISLTIRVTKGQREKLERMGGAAAIRAFIDSSPD